MYLCALSILLTVLQCTTGTLFPHGAVAGREFSGMPIVIDRMAMRPVLSPFVYNSYPIINRFPGLPFATPLATDAIHMVPENGFSGMGPSSRIPITGRLEILTGALPDGRYGPIYFPMDRFPLWPGVTDATGFATRNFGMSGFQAGPSPYWSGTPYSGDFQMGGPGSQMMSTTNQGFGGVGPVTSGGLAGGTSPIPTTLHAGLQLTDALRPMAPEIRIKSLPSSTSTMVKPPVHNHDGHQHSEKSLSKPAYKSAKTTTKMPLNSEPQPRLQRVPHAEHVHSAASHDGFGQNDGFTAAENTNLMVGDGYSPGIAGSITHSPSELKVEPLTNAKNHV